MAEFTERTEHFSIKKTGEGDSSDIDQLLELLMATVASIMTNYRIDNYEFDLSDLKPGNVIRIALDDGKVTVSSPGLKDGSIQ
jgi:hypothetical protein